ncbi:MAG TPA: hypothetical protein PLE01_04845 [Syntrophothermus lipocalidus]|nr:hypothetical protein [Syntrophothermus lipocalidus]
MSTAEITEQILKELARLSPEAQLLVLNFARRLGPFPQKGVPGRDLMRFSGVLSREEADEIERAVEEGCEKKEGPFQRTTSGLRLSPSRMILF